MNHPGAKNGTSKSPDSPNQAGFQIRVEGFEGTPEQIEQQWYEKVYRGRGDSMAQLTWRAILMGSVLGGVLSLTNLYVGLKSGWGFGVAITACILSYAIWTTLFRIGLAKTRMTILENNCMQSTASAAGYSTGTTLVSAFPAFMLITGQPLPLGLTLAWVFLLAVLGVTMAIPMKRQMINIEQLRFPSGVAAAETLNALHSHGDKGMRAAKALGVAGVLAALSQFLTDGLRLVSGSLASLQIGSLLSRANELTLGKAWMGRTVMFVWDPIFIAAGAITGMRVCLSMLLSATLCWAIYVPILQSKGIASTFTAVELSDPEAQSGFVQKLSAGADPVSAFIWARIPVETRQTLQDTNTTAATRTALLTRDLDRLLTSSALYEPARFAGVKLSPQTASLAARTPQGPELVRLNRQLLEETYPGIVPRSTGFKSLIQWTLWGGTGCMVSAGLLSFLFQWRTSLRAFRNLGKMFRRGGDRQEPVDALEAPTSWFLVAQVVGLAALAYLGKITFGMPWWLAGLAFVLSFVLALVACRVTGETDTTPLSAMGQITQLTVGAIHPGSATTTLMSANVVSGAAMASADLLTDLKSGYLLGANPRKQFLAQFSGIFIGTLVTVLAFSVLVPTPKVLGSDQFPAPSAQTWRAVALAMSKGIADLHPVKKWSLVAGISVGVCLAVVTLLFPRKTKYIPSAAGAGLAWTFHWYYSLLFFLGALGAWFWKKKAPQSAEEYTFPVASGIIAGGSLMGVFLIFWENGGELLKVFARLLGR